MTILKMPLRKLRLTAFAVLGLVVASTSCAMTIRELRALEVSNKKQGEAYVNYYLVGVMEGAMEAQAQDVRKGARPSICLNGRRLLPSMARSLFDTELQRNEGVYEADMAAQLVLTNALATVYPC